MAQITTALDEWMVDQDKPYWIATLSDGTTVLQDDNRPGLEPIAWFRLRDYCAKNGLDIKSLGLRFRSHYEFSTEVERGAFFRRGALSHLNSGRTNLFYILGSIGVDDKIRTKKWSVPELLLEEEDVREIEGNEESIIWNLSHHQPIST